MSAVPEQKRGGALKTVLRLSVAGGVLSLGAWTVTQGMLALGSYVPVSERAWAGQRDAGGLLLASHGVEAEVIRPAEDAPRLEFVPLAIAGHGLDPDAPGNPKARNVIDIAALQFFAQQGDFEAVQREVARIRLTHPDFVPPELSTEPPVAGPSEDLLWDLLHEGRTPELRREMAAMTGRGGYQPSPELTLELGKVEGRAAIAAAAEGGRWGDVVAVAEATPALLDCAEMQILWWAAEGFVHVGQVGRAVDTYRYIFATCTNPEERAASMVKAAALLPLAALPGALPQDASAQAIISDAAGGRLRMAIGRWLSVVAPQVPDGNAGASDRCLGPFVWEDGPTDEEIRALMAQPVPSNEAAAADAAHLASIATTPKDARLLGWYYHAAERYQDAMLWFGRSVERGPTAEAMTGLVLATRDAGDRDGARTLAATHKMRHPALACLYLGMATEDLNRNVATTTDELKQLTLELRSAEAAQQLGWHVLENDHVTEARDWFARSVEWKASEPGVLGLAVTEDRLGNRAKAAELAKAYPDYPQVAVFVQTVAEARKIAAAPRRQPKPAAQQTVVDKANVMMEEAMAAFRAEKWGQVVEILDRRRAIREETQDVAMVRGWALFHGGKLKAAYTLFKDLDQQRSTAKTREGMMVSWRRMMPWRFH